VVYGHAWTPENKQAAIDVAAPLIRQHNPGHD
jgi:hypothetical protein